VNFVSFNRISRLLAALISLFALCHPARAQDDQGYFMPIGDSITEGYDPGGWRDPLYTDLVNSGYSFTYEGAHNTFAVTYEAGQSDGSALLVSKGEDYNNGWSGATTVYVDSSNVSIYDSLPAWFSGPDLIPSPGANVLPNLVTLEIGTNDILLGNTNVASLEADLDSDITRIISLDPTADLIVAQITPLTGAYAALNPEVIAFNEGIPALVAAHDALGQNVSIVDLYDTISLDGSEQHDGIHPTEAGDDAIATAYLNAIEQIDPVPEPSVLALLVPGAALLIVLRRRLGRCA
jgi:lysophospholipase L1-like esterase